MQGRFYPDVFSRQGITLVAPDLDDQVYINHKYLSELTLGVLLPETRQGLLAIVDRLKKSSGIQGLILGGTELPLILREARRAVPFLDTSKVHAEHAVAKMLS